VNYAPATWGSLGRMIAGGAARVRHGIAQRGVGGAHSAASFGSRGMGHFSSPYSILRAYSDSGIPAFMASALITACSWRGIRILNESVAVSFCMVGAYQIGIGIALRISAYIQRG